MIQTHVVIYTTEWDCTTLEKVVKYNQWRSQDFPKGEANFHGDPKVTSAKKN